MITRARRLVATSPPSAMPSRIAIIEPGAAMYSPRLPVSFSQYNWLDMLHRIFIQKAVMAPPITTKPTYSSGRRWPVDQHIGHHAAEGHEHIEQHPGSIALLADDARVGARHDGFQEKPPAGGLFYRGVLTHSRLPFPRRPSSGPPGSTNTSSRVGSCLESCMILTFASGEGVDDGARAASSSRMKFRVALPSASWQVTLWTPGRSSSFADRQPVQRAGFNLKDGILLQALLQRPRVNRRPARGPG